ncbi:MAG: ComEC/Rec2 family competence protein, partial [Lachnospiraceae bacterium]|nr:ComEC/Rec2 family competence protein [Lachnospiraceae bacterium]
MRKRPLALLCVAVAVFLVLAGTGRHAKRNDMLLEVQEYLTNTAETDNTLTLEGDVAEVCAVSEGIRLSVNRISIFTKDSSQIILSSDLKLILTIDTDKFLPGDTIRITGNYKPFAEAGNPGQFDLREYYFSLDTVGRLTDPKVTLLEEGGRSVSRVLARLRRTLRGSYLRILDEKAAHTVSAISLGEKSFMEQEWKQLYQEGGIAHIISISGLHISLIGMCIYRLLRRIGFPFFAAALPSAAVVVLYAMMSGFSVSAMRAGIMFVIWLGAQIAGRKSDMLTSVAVAAVVILAEDASAVCRSSFLLSFGAILSIALLAPRLQAANPFCKDGWKRERPLAALDDRTVRPLKSASRRTNRIIRLGEKLWNSICGGLSIWLGSLPVTLWFFYQTSPWSILVNLAVIPLMSALMASALISCLVGLISVPAGIFLSAPVYYLLGLFEWLCTLERRLPCAVWIAGRPAIWKIAAYYGLLAGAVAVSAAIRKKSLGDCKKSLGDCKKSLCNRDKNGLHDCDKKSLWYLAIACSVFLMAFHPRAGLTISCLDVGQGDGTLIQFSDGTVCMIDGGSSSVSDLWEYRISQT